MRSEEEEETTQRCPPYTSFYKLWETVLAEKDKHIPHFLFLVSFLRLRTFESGRRGVGLYRYKGSFHLPGEMAG